MSWADEIPIREDLLAQAKPLIAKHRGKHVLQHWDVQMQTWITPGTTQFVNAWCLVLVVAGALVGREHTLSYTWTFQPPDQRPPEEREIDAGVQAAFKQLSLMQVRQLQTQNRTSGEQSPN